MMMVMVWWIVRGVVFVVNFRIFEDFVKVLLLLLLLLEDICDDALKDMGDGWMHGVWVDAWCVGRCMVCGW